MNLPQPLQRIYDEFAAGKSPADMTRIGITAIALVLTLLTAATAGSSAPNNNDGSSQDGGGNTSPEQPDDSGYTPPPAHIQLRLDTIRTEVYGAVNKSRAGQGLGSAFEYPERSEDAQQKAEHNAVHGSWDQSEEDIGMVQAKMPLETASGYEFFELIRQSPEDLAVLMEPSNLFMAVGTAYSAHDDTVWLVIQTE